MVSDLRRQGLPLGEIAAKVTDECCTNYYCKDNVTLLIVDLKAHHASHTLKLQKKNSKRYHSQIRNGQHLSSDADMAFSSNMMPLEGQLRTHHWSPQMHQAMMVNF